MVSLNPLLLCALLLSLAASAELVTIQTINGVFTVPKQSILEGPDGYLKSIYQNEGIMRTALQEDGSLFVNVDPEAMRHVLSFIRHKNLDNKKIRSSHILKNDVDFLLPGVLTKNTRPKRQKVWQCAAYCDPDRDKATEFIWTSHIKISHAWQNLGNLCSQKGKEYYLLKQHIHAQSEYRDALASMGDSCVQTYLE